MFCGGDLLSVGLPSGCVLTNDATCLNAAGEHHLPTGSAGTAADVHMVIGCVAPIAETDAKHVCCTWQSLTAALRADTRLNSSAVLWSHRRCWRRTA